jgi:hypothetical protein
MDKHHMPAALRATVLTALITLLLAGIVDLVSLGLGGGFPVALLTLGGVLLALGWGAVHEGAGPPPARASFAWLGLAAALPVAAVWAPWAGIGGLLLILPLRATGARLAGMVAERPSALTGAVCGAILGVWWVLANGLGLPVYLTAWALTGLAQRALLMPPHRPRPDDPVPVGTVLYGAGVAWLLLALWPWLDILDSSSSTQDALRFMPAAVVFLLGWVTVGGAAAEWRHHRIVSLLAAVVLGALATGLAQDAAFYTSKAGYTASIGSRTLREWTGSDAPFLSEENPAYPMVLSLAMLALPMVLSGLMLRALGGKQPRGRAFLSPLLAGAGAALVLAGTAPAAFTAAGATLAAGALLGGAALEGWRTRGKRAARIVFAGVPLLAAAVFVRPTAPPLADYPFQDAYTWRVATDEEGRPMQEVTLSSVVRVVERESPVAGEAQFTMDGRNFAAPAVAERAAWLNETRFVADLVGDPQRVLLVGTPWGAAMGALREAGAEDLVQVCDPPQLARMEFRRAGIAGVETHRTVSAAGDGFDVVLLRDTLLWDGRHHLLRRELLEQCRRRVETGGVVAFAASPAQFEPGMLPQWLDDFRTVFPVAEVYLLPEGPAAMRLVLVGRDTPSGVPDADVLRIKTQELPAGRLFLFRAPARRSLVELAATERKLVDGLRSVKRAADVLAELREQERGDRASLLGFYAEQLAAQQYSAHDELFASPYATEIGPDALVELMRVTRTHPDSPTLHRTWADVGRALVEQREVEAIDRWFTLLHDELGWRDPEVLLTLAHAAWEMLDDALALEFVDAALAQRAGWRPAEEMRALVVAGEGPQVDMHTGHDHD